MKRYQNLVMIIGVVLLVALPLWVVKKPVPGPGDDAIEIFRGTDDQAKDVISRIAPGYQPWFKPVMEPPGGEVSSLLFALQAALGAGFIGYYLGVATTRARIRREKGTEVRC